MQIIRGQSKSQACLKPKINALNPDAILSCIILREDNFLVMKTRLKADCISFHTQGVGKEVALVIHT